MTALWLVILAQAAVPSKSAVPVAIVVSSRRDALNTLSPQLCDELKKALAAEGVVAMSDAESTQRLVSLGGVEPRACDGSKLCLQRLAELLRGVVIGVDVGKVQRFSAGHLEALAIDRAESIGVADITADGKSWQKKSASAAIAFARKIAPVVLELERVRQEQLRADAMPPQVTDVPRQASLLPDAPLTPPPELTVRRSRGPVPYVLLGAAIAAAGAAVAMLILGLADANRYNGSLQPLAGGTTSSFTQAQLNGLAASGNLKFSIAAGCGAGALVLAALATWFLVRE